MTSYIGSTIAPEYFKRENRPPYFKAFTETEGFRRNKELDENEAGDRSTVNQVSAAEVDSTAGKPTLPHISSFSSLRNLKESLKNNLSEPIVQISLHQQNTANISALLKSSNLSTSSSSSENNIITPTWRLKERMKTVGVCLVLALNIGTDPPDVNRPKPCAKLQCWMDPTVISRAKAREQIGEKLEYQYARWQKRLKLRFKRALDPTVEEVRSLCLTMRRQAKNERLLLHYNGHGVPRPTSNGEIWLFDQKHTQYIPLSISDLRQWIGKPSILVLDCSGAGVLLPFLAAPLEGLDQYMQQVAMHPSTTVAAASSSSLNSSSNAHSHPMVNMNIDINSPSQSSNNTNIGGLIPPMHKNVNKLDETEFASRSVRDCIVLCPCAEKELLPMNPEFPADIFTSCLTTPIPIALRWFVHQNPLSMEGVDPECVDRIPGTEDDRKTPLGELNWIFTAITDTIAWNVLPSPLFQRLFRQDLLVASMFRNFLLADRILRSMNCTPMSIPSLPSTCNHPLWQAWDLAVETCLHQLMRDGHLNINPESSRTPTPTPSANDVSVEETKGIDTKHTEEQLNKMQKGIPSDIPNLNQPDFRPSLRLQNSPNTTTPPQLLNNHQTPQSSVPNSNITSPFFAEQLTAFEIWLEFASTKVLSNLSSNNNTEQVPNATSLTTSFNMTMNENNGLESPEQLPVVLQVLLSQAHRVRALILLKSFLDLGPWAVNLALSVGIFPYVLRLLKSHVDEYKHVLVGIWAKILTFDPSCQVDLVKDSAALEHFIGHLKWGLTPLQTQFSSDKSSMRKGEGGAPMQSNPSGNTGKANKQDAAVQRTMAAFIISIICLDYPLGQTECLKQRLHETCSDLLLSLELVEKPFPSEVEEPNEHNAYAGNKARTSDRKGDDSQKNTEARKSLKQKQLEYESMKQKVKENVTPQFRLWICICLGNLWENCNTSQLEAYESACKVTQRVYARLMDEDPDVRAGAAFALGRLIGNTSPDTEKKPSKNKNFMPGIMSAPHAMIPPTAMRGVGISTINNYPISSSSSGNGNPQSRPFESTAQGLNLVAGVGANANIGGLVWQQPPNTNAQNSQHRQFTPYHPNPNVNMMGQVIPRYTSKPTTRSSGSLTTTTFLNQSTPNLQQSMLFQDTRRVSCDLETAKKLVKATIDASAMVRYEATLSLACLVKKYFAAFAAVADEISSTATNANFEDINEENSSISSSSDEGNNLGGKNSIEFPFGLNTTKIEQFRDIWKALRLLQHKEPHPAPASAANDIVSVVHEHILMIKTENLKGKVQESTIPNSMYGSDAEQRNKINNRTHSMMALSNVSTSKENDLSFSEPTYQISDNKAVTNLKTTDGFFFSSQSQINLSSNSTGILHTNKNDVSAFPKKNVSHENGSSTSHHESQFRIEYHLPKSEFYVWKRKDFEEKKKPCTNSTFDPLSSMGAINIYRERRNKYHNDKGLHLADYFSSLATQEHQNMPNSKYDDFSSHSGSIKDNRSYHDESNDEATAVANSNLEIENSNKKKILQLRQCSLLRNVGVNMTSSLKFHSYEPALVVCDGCDGISVWDISEKSNSIENRMCVFKNGNPPRSRMTSTAWINEESNSLLLVASDDGIVKIWDGLIKNRGGLNKNKPTLASSFLGDPDLVAGQRGSGLVSEWQQYSGKLITGGNGEFIRCWDLEVEKCINKFHRKENDSCVTTLTTAWDELTLNGTSSSGANGYSGIGPNIVVAGYGNGSMKVFDIRLSQSESMVLPGTNLTKDYVKGNSPKGIRMIGRRNRLMEYDEHKSWIVNTLFTGHGGRYEIISGCVAGDLKFWDLRYPSSTRSLNVQRGNITALAGHPRVPMLVTGSHAQYIKMFALDGDTLSIIKYHESNSQRIGPISCLSFHPNRLLLAAGSTDEIVSIYGPRQS